MSIPSVPFAVELHAQPQGQNAGQNAFNVVLGLNFKVSESAELYVNANYEIANNASQYGFGGGFRVRF